MSRVTEARPQLHAVMYIALIAAWIATAGSLYMSEVLGWLPCTWCWYQRIAMYPLSLLLTVGIARRDVNIATYALLLAVPGALASIWHILIQKVDRIALLYPCRSASPCTSDSLWSLGWFPFWATVPMLALAAFVAIILACVIALVADRRTRVAADVIEGLPPAAFVSAIVFAILALFGVSAFLNAPRTGPETWTPPASKSPGAQTFSQSCQGCHTPNGQGYVNIRASWLSGKTDAEIVAFLKKGRAVTEADNFSKQAMPPYGGQPFLSEAQLLELTQHLQGK
jgi:disulfide bond formation protein DsbB/cytochrome c5